MMIKRRCRFVTAWPVCLRSNHYRGPSSSYGGFFLIQVTMDLKEMKTGLFYTLTTENKDDVQLAIIGCNRKEKKQIANKLESCEKVGMLTPAVWVPARLVKDSGLPILDAFTGQDIPDDKVDDYQCVMEGHNRLYAWQQALEKAKLNPSYVPFDYKYVLQDFESPEAFRDAYHHMNMYNVPTRAKDFANEVFQTTDNKVVKAYKQKIDDGLTAKAAGIATVGKEIKRADVVAFFLTGKSTVLDDDSLVDYTDTVYQAVRSAFACEKGKVKPVLKGTEIWDFVAEFYSKTKTKDEREIATAKLEALFLSLPAPYATRILTAKATNEQTRQQVVRSILKEYYQTI